MKNKNIILTGLPRSGTTLVCHLLNKVDDTIALHEPMGQSQQQSVEGVCGEISDFFTATRSSILQKKSMLSVNVNGQTPDNIIGDELNTDGLRQGITGMVKSNVAIEKALSEDFTLCIKHNALFTALLEGLIADFCCYAVIRNPLAVLASWNSVDLPINRGHIPAAERLDIGLAMQLKKIPDAIDRQLHILAWFFDRYKLLPENNIIRYESLVLSGGQSLSVMTEKTLSLSEPLVNKNNNVLYDKKMMGQLAERLLDAEGGFWQFYTAGEVKLLLK